MHLDFWLKLPEKQALAEGLMELDQPVSVEVVSVLLKHTNYRQHKADSTDLSVVAKVRGGALPADDRACPSQGWLKEYEAKL